MNKNKEKSIIEQTLLVLKEDVEAKPFIDILQRMEKLELRLEDQ